MNTKLTHGIFLSLIALVAIVGAVLYPQLPEQIASHWNVAGEADGYMPKFWGVFLFPIIMLGLYAAYVVIPKIDPLKANIESFRKQYDVFFLGLNVFFAYLFALAMLWNSGYRFDFGRAMVPALATLMWGIGSLIQCSKRNWFVGIRTPWTLSSDYVWKKTHKLGGKLFKIAAVVSLLGLLFGGSIGFYLTIGPIVAIAAFTIVYSYVLYRKEQSGRDAQ